MQSADNKEYGAIHETDEEVDVDEWRAALNTKTVDELRASYDWLKANFCYTETNGHLALSTAIAESKWDLVNYLLDLRMPPLTIAFDAIQKKECPVAVFKNIVDACLVESKCPYCNDDRRNCDHSDKWLLDYWDLNQRITSLRDKGIPALCAEYRKTVDAKAKVALLFDATGDDWDSLLQLLP